MKWIIYFLLICNIGFAAWHFRGLESFRHVDSALNENSVSGAESKRKAGTENQLLLLSELKNKPKSSLGARLCFSLGPFSEEADSKEVQRMLTDSGIETTQIDLKDTSRSGYWVTLPVNKTAQDARKQIEQLKKLKVKDYFLVATGSHANAVSLGVYSLKSSARRRIDEMIKLGFVAQMERVVLPQKVYWLNWYKAAKAQPEDAMISKIKNIYPQISKIERSCK